ncbi:MAG TPA: alpha/beta hydrolase [Candidatus Baltobacteraceae bacterium]|nr:alpha/beta hydrolase [Candidatus Baltobacteraceae bacterium]
MQVRPVRGFTAPPYHHNSLSSCRRLHAVLALQWNAQINALSSRYDLYVVTLPGFAGRVMVAGGDLDARAIRGLHLLIRERHLRRAILVGHSLGGTLAVLYAETHPHDLGALISVEGGYPVAPTVALRAQRVAAATAPFEHVTRAALGTVMRERQLQYLITRPADVGAVERLAAQSDPRAIVA